MDCRAEMKAMSLQTYGKSDTANLGWVKSLFHIIKNIKKKLFPNNGSK